MRKRTPPTLYHISFKEVQDSIWKPTVPAGSVEAYQSKVSIEEPLLPRICCSESLDGCFIAVYPNISLYFEVEHYPYLDFFFYTPVITQRTMCYSPEELQEKKWVHDAHVTREWILTTPTAMHLVGKVRFDNTTKSKNWVTSHPFNDKRIKERTLSPPPQHTILPYVNHPHSSGW